MRSPLDVDALRCFVVLAEELHFGRAAARLEMAQPSLSNRIAALESAVGGLLFNRSSRGVALTAGGQALLDDARRLLLDCDRLFSRARKIAAGEIGELRVGFVASGAYALLPPIARRFRELRPDADLQVDECALRLPLDQLENGALHAALVRGPVRHPTLQVEPLLREALCVVLPSAHPLASRRSTTLAALRGESFALFPRHRAPVFHDAITGACRAAGFSPRISHEAADWQVLVSLVAAGLAVSVAPEAVAALPRDGVVFLRVTPRHEIAELDLVYPAGPTSPLVDTFLRAAREVASSASWRQSATRGALRARRIAGVSRSRPAR